MAENRGQEFKNRVIVKTDSFFVCLSYFHSFKSEETMDLPTGK